MIVTITELFEMDKYINLSGFNFSIQDEEKEDVNDIWSSLKLSSIVETYSRTMEETNPINITLVSEDLPPVDRIGLRRTRNDSRRVCVVNYDPFCSQSESLNSRNTTFQSIALLAKLVTGSYRWPRQSAQL